MGWLIALLVVMMEPMNCLACPIFSFQSAGGDIRAQRKAQDDSGDAIVAGSGARCECSSTNSPQPIVMGEMGASDLVESGPESA